MKNKIYNFFIYNFNFIYIYIFIFIIKKLNKYTNFIINI